MNLRVEDFLEEAFGSLEPTSDKVGRVVVEPDYEATVSPDDAAPLAVELRECLQESIPAVPPPQLDIRIPERFTLLRHYLRQITLHTDEVELPWIEVAPPGNWI